MANRVKELGKLIGIPPAPEDNVGDWEAVEKQLSCSLPSDYKEFVTVFGTGYIGRWIELHSPFAANRAINFFELNNLVRMRYEARIEWGGKFVYPVYPDPNGLLAWGISVTSCHMLWLRFGQPDEWGTLVWDSEMEQFFEYPDLSMSAFLEKAVIGTLSPQAFGPDVFWGPPVFTS